MTEYFNKLTPAELERLAILGEEMGEAAQIVGKIVRHGYESCDTTDPNSVTNRHLLEREIGHVRHAVARMVMEGDIDPEFIEGYTNAKSEAIGQWLHHQEPAL